MEPIPSPSLARAAQPVAGQTFASDSPIGILYASSLARAEHYEGPAAMNALNTYVHDLRTGGMERATPTAFNSRMHTALGFAGSVFETIPEVEAVVLYGSALRGKLDPKDFDVRLVTRYMEPNHIDFEHPVMNEIQSTVDAAFKAHAEIPKAIDGVPIQAMVNCSFHDSMGMELDYVERGPYLAVLRSNTPSTSYHPSYPMFANFSGREFLQERAA